MVFTLYYFTVPIQLYIEHFWLTLENQHWNVYRAHFTGSILKQSEKIMTKSCLLRRLYRQWKTKHLIPKANHVKMLPCGGNISLSLLMKSQVCGIKEMIKVAYHMTPMCTWVSLSFTPLSTAEVQWQVWLISYWHTCLFDAFYIHMPAYMQHLGASSLSSTHSCIRLLKLLIDDIERWVKSNLTSPNNLLQGSFDPCLIKLSGLFVKSQFSWLVHHSLTLWSAQAL